MTAMAVASRTVEIGREIFSRLQGQRHPLFSARWLDDQMMRLTMRDEALKVQLFRLVDTLPALKTDAAVARHLREYLLQAADHLLGPLRLATRSMPRQGFAAELVAQAARFNAVRLARKFIAG